jgi:hypothetical protein
MKHAMRPNNLALIHVRVRHTVYKTKLSQNNLRFLDTHVSNLSGHYAESAVMLRLVESQNKYFKSDHISFFPRALRYRIKKFWEIQCCFIYS